jgi:F-type H+-transporting ATPase subunit b
MSFSWTTFALQAVNFLVLVWLLTRFLFKPVRAIVSRRKAEIARAQAEAEAARQSADKARKSFEARRLEIEAQQQSIIDQARAAMAVEQSKMIEAARADIEKLKTAAGKRLDEERENAARELFERSLQIAVGLAQRLLKQVAAPRLDELFLDRVLDQFDHLNETERAALLGQAGRDSGEVVVTTAYPLGAGAEAQWRAALSKRVAGSQPIIFAVNSNLIAGTELKFPHATLRFSWRDNLADAQQELLQHEHTG